MHILVSDDDPTLRFILRQVLTQLGHQVTLVEDGTQALVQWQEQRPDVLITDWIMPGINGLELCACIRQSPPGPYTYIILLTTKSSTAELIEALNAGADDFMIKPPDRDLLEARLVVAKRIIQLQRDFTNISGLLPMCAYCRKIRDAKEPPHGHETGNVMVQDQEEWMNLEEYVRTHMNAQISHGICPDCFKNVAMPELSAYLKNRSDSTE